MTTGGKEFPFLADNISNDAFVSSISAKDLLRGLLMGDDRLLSPDSIFAREYCDVGGEYKVGILNPDLFPEETKQVLKEQDIDQRDLLLSTNTATSVISTDLKRMKYTYRFLLNLQAKDFKENPRLQERYYRSVLDHLRGEMVDFLSIKNGESGQLKAEDRILFHESGTHSSMALSMLLDKAPVIMTNEVGRSLKTAYEGKHPFSTDLYGVDVAKNGQVVTNHQREVIEVPIRESRPSEIVGKEIDAGPRRESDIRDDIIANIKKQIAKGETTVIVHVPLPPKTGLNPAERLEWVRNLRDVNKQRTMFDLGTDAVLPRIIVVGDMAQTRFVYGTDDDGKKPYDPTDKENGFCDIAMFTVSKAIGGLPLTGILVMNEELAREAKQKVATLQPDYIKHYVSLDQLPDSWTKDVRTIKTDDDPPIETENPLWKGVRHHPVIAARLLSAGDLISDMEKIGVVEAQNNAREIKARWKTILANHPVLEKVYSDRSDDNTPSTLAFRLDSVQDQKTAENIRRYLLTPFDNRTLDNLQEWHLTPEQIQAMRILCEVGFPVSEAAEGLEGGKHKPIMRVGIGWRQVIDWNDPTRQKQITSALDILATKMEILIAHQDQLSALERYSMGGKKE